MPDGWSSPQKRARRLPEQFDNHREGYKDNLVFFSLMDDLVDDLCGLIGFTPSIYYFKFGEQTLRVICKHLLLYVSSQSTLSAPSFRQYPPGSFSPSWFTSCPSDQKCQLTAQLHVKEFKHKLLEMCPIRVVFSTHAGSV